MKKWRIILSDSFVLIVSAFIISAIPAFALSNDATSTALAEPIPVDDDLIVRVYFDDMKTAYNIAAWIEPLESDYERGYLVIEVSSEEYDRLIETCLQVEVDFKLKAEIAKAQQQVPPGARTIPGFPCYRTVEEKLLLPSQSPQTIRTWPPGPTLAIRGKK